MNLPVTVASPLALDSGTPSTVGLSAGTVEPGEFNVYVYNRVVSVGGDSKFFLEPGEERTVNVSFVNDLLGAPGAVTITVGTRAGAGTNSVSWVGGATIPDGASESDGCLDIIGDTGVNTITLSVDNGFRFQESSAASVTITVIAYSSPIYVSGGGSDVTGDGSEANPLRTITYALTVLKPEGEIDVLPGLYDAAGEVFPITLPATCSIVGTVGPMQDEIDSAMIDAGGATYAFTLAECTSGQTSLLKDVVLTTSSPPSTAPSGAAP